MPSAQLKVKVVLGCRRGTRLQAGLAMPWRSRWWHRQRRAGQRCGHQIAVEATGPWRL